VEQVAGLNETAGIVYFTATYDSPIETHLYSTNLFVEFDWSPLKPKRLTEGCHNVVLDHNIQRFVDIHDSLISPPRVLLCSLEDGSILVSIYEQPGPTPRTGRFQLVRL
jgi:dipeptidyl-peptidase-4